MNFGVRKWICCVNVKADVQFQRDAFTTQILVSSNTPKQCWEKLITFPLKKKRDYALFFCSSVTSDVTLNTV